MQRSHTVLIAGLLGLGATLALAAASEDPRDSRQQHRQEHAASKLAEDDSNHDGKLSRSEWQAARLRQAAEQFRRLDGNRDGSISREEMQAGRAQRAGRHGGGMREKLRGMDANGDQQLSRTELGDKMPRLAQDFDRLDANRDGKLSREEIRAGREQRRERGEDAQR